MTAMNLKRSFRPFVSDSDNDANVPARISNFERSWLAIAIGPKALRAFGLGSQQGSKA